MKRFLILLILIFLIVYSYIYLSSKRNINTNNYKVPENTNEIISVTAIPSSPMTTKDGGYKNSWIIVRDLKKIRLYPNLDYKLSSDDAKIKYNCESIVSAGFFTKDNNYIGLFIGEGGKENDLLSSNFFNGYFYIDNKFNAFINDTVPKDIIIALQSGPILIKNSLKTNLSIKDDENDRRIILAITKEGYVVFLTIYSNVNVNLGPKLADLPSILEDLNINTNLKIINALNLDGGTHSTFQTNLLSLKESSIPGAYFCIKP